MPNDYGHEYADKELKSLEKRIAKEYKQAAKEVEKKMNDYLAKFADKDVQMKKRLEAGEITASEYAEWRMRQMFTGDRWKAMSDTLSADLVNADKIAAGMINDSLPSSYAENFNYGTYEVESGANMSTSFALYDKNTVANLMKDDPKIIPKANVDIPKDMVWNKRKIISAVTQGILQGEAIPKIAKRLQSVTDMDRRAAIRNARTYTTAAENKGRVDSYDRAKEMGINVKKEWLATLDERTRMEHRHLDGMAVDNDEPFEVDGYKIMYPGDPSAEPEMIYNCRCAIVARIADYKYNDERNDSKLGDMTYEEWKHAKDKEHSEKPISEEKVNTEEKTSGVVNGTDISTTWQRRSDEFEFEIEDIINAQGFDGLPRVVDAEEFDNAVKESNFIAQRTYSATDQETLQAYQDSLYNGKWYVDCSVGGSAHGKGMYSAASYDGELNDEIKQEMKDYIGQNTNYTSQDAPYIIETFTIDPSAKFLEIPKGMDDEDYVHGLFSNSVFLQKSTEIGLEEPAKKIIEISNEKSAIYNAYLKGQISSEKIWEKNDELNQKMNNIASEYKELKEIRTDAVKLGNKINDIGSLAALMGYDGLHTHYGTCGNDTIILNRTKLIFKRG